MERRVRIRLTAPGLAIRDTADGSDFGHTVSVAGDVNQDGFDDFLVSTRYRFVNGRTDYDSTTYLIYGGDVAQGTGQAPLIDVRSLTAQQGVVIHSEPAAFLGGNSLSAAGDLNGDGIDDFLVGQYASVDVIFGSRSGVGTNGRLDPNTLTAQQGLLIKGGVGTGNSISSAGDVNGDGFADIVVGAFGNEYGGARTGATYVLYGSADGFGTQTMVDGHLRQYVDLRALTPDQGFIVRGSPGDRIGVFVGGAGDVDGDGFDDILTAAYGGSGSRGKFYLIFGSADGPGDTVGGAGSARRVLDLAALTAADGIAFVGATGPGDFARGLPLNGGDVDRDGFADFLLGSVLDPRVIFGGSFAASTQAVIRTGTEADDILVGGAGEDVLAGGGGIDVLRGGAGDDRLVVTGDGFRAVDGGYGADTLAIDAAGQVLDLTDTTRASRSQSIERIDLAAAGAQTVVLDRRAILALSEERSAGVATVTVTGNPGDTVRFTELQWTQTGTIVQDGATYRVFHHAGGGVEVRVEAGVGTPFKDESAPLTIGLATLTGTQGLVIRGAAADDRAGYSVGGAGDLNGDGLADFVVGAPGNGAAGVGGGAAYVVFGTRDLLGTIQAGDGSARRILDLGTLASSQGVVIVGAEGDTAAGLSVRSAGDANGDGFADLLVGAPFDGQNLPGRSHAYLIFGTETGFGALVNDAGYLQQRIDLAALSQQQGVEIRSANSYESAGFSVSGAGDVNGDGLADIIVGARGLYGDAVYSGGAYVIYGTATGFGNREIEGDLTRRVIDLGTLDPAQGFAIVGDTQAGLAGNSVSAAGDVNGDGFADVIVGAPIGGATRRSGEAFVVFGGAGGGDVDLATLTAQQGFVIRGATTGDGAGSSVSGGSDLNGDGLADLVVGATRAGGGETYVLFGTTAGFGTATTESGATRQVVDLATLAGADGFVIRGVTDSGTGYSVSAAGDLDGDGFGALLVGAPGATGASYLLFGTAAGFGTAVTESGGTRQVIDLTTLTAAQGFVIRGEGGGAGASVSAAGDVNGDGFADLLVGAPGGGAGGAYLIFGGAFGGGATPVVATGETLAGSVGDDVLTGAGGRDVLRGGAGDDRLVVADATFASVDGGSGRDTLALAGAGQTLDLTDRTGAARLASIERIDLSAAGGQTLRLDALAVQALSEARSDGDAVLTVAGGSADTVRFAEGASQWTRTMVTDGGESVAVYRSAQGNATVRIDAAVAVTFGVEPARTGVDLATLSPGQGFTIQGAATGDRAGTSVAALGDVNGDGVGDFAVGAPRNDGGGTDAGAAHIVFGIAAAGVGFAYIDLATLSATRGFTIRGDTGGDQAGYSVAGAGDVNGDGIDDIVIGAPVGGDGGRGAGEAYVVFGTRNGFGSTTTVNGVTQRIVDLTTLTVAQGFVVQGDTGFDNAGLSVSAAGDLNDDGIADLAVGAYHGDDGGSNAGEAYVLFGTRGTFGSAVTVAGQSRQVVDLTTLSAAQGFVIQGDSTDDQAGRSVADAGDVNGDGISDLLVGAPTDGTGFAGGAYLLFGGGTAGGGGGGGSFGTPVTTNGVTRMVVDLTTLSAAQGVVIRGDGAGDRAGYGVSAAGDINGDGLADFLVGAPFGGGGDRHAGETYVIFGSRGGFGTLVDNNGQSQRVLDLGTLSAGQGFVVEGATDGERAGYSVSAAGDVNGDGIGDILVGARAADGAAGVAYVVYGSDTGFGTPVREDGALRQVLDLSTLAPAQGFAIHGAASGDAAGFAVSAAGDVNLDGFDDVLVGAPGSDAGAAYVIFGSATPPVTAAALDAAVFAGLDDRAVHGYDLHQAFGQPGMIAPGDLRVCLV